MASQHHHTACVCVENPGLHLQHCVQFLIERLGPTDQGTAAARQGTTAVRNDAGSANTEGAELVKNAIDHV
eukprot:12936078-Prorocentrum_lima.AAC.1